MVTVEAVLRRARSMLVEGTVYWAGAGGLDPQSPASSQRVKIADEWPRLTPAEQAQFRPLALQAGIDVDDPNAAVQACDCTGFLCWALGISRKAPRQEAWTLAGGWINTDSIWSDATHGGAMFRKLDRAVPGCVVVYPKAGSNEQYGHDGLVTAVGSNGIATRVIHCSASNFKAAPFDAVKENTGEAFLHQKATVYAWFRGMQPAQ